MEPIVIKCLRCNIKFEVYRGGFCPDCFKYHYYKRNRNYFYETLYERFSTEIINSYFKDIIPEYIAFIL